MYDVTFLIPDYTDWQDEEDFTPPDPDSGMPETERDRLFEELCAMIDAGAFDPENEILA
jgi:hypothetical protein